MRLLAPSTSISKPSLHGLPSGHWNVGVPTSISTTALQYSESQRVATLDDHFVPGPVIPQGPYAQAAVIAVVLAFGLTMRRIIQGVFSKNREEVAETDSTSHNFADVLHKIVSGITYPIRWVVRSLFGRGSSNTQRPTVSEWRAGSLERKDIINDRFMFYRFEHDSTSGKQFPLRQKIIVCAEGSDGMPIKEEYFPTTVGMSEGQFGIVTRIFKRSPDDRISVILPALNYGDEVAFKAGSNIFNYRGSEDPVRFLTLVASGVGIVPVYELLRNALSRESVDSCELLWINDSKEDFIFNNEIEKLEHEYPDRFFCARVLDPAVSEEDRALNDKVRDALPLAEKGRVALLAAPAAASYKIKAALDTLLYEPSNVITVPLQ